MSEDPARLDPGLLEAYRSAARWTGDIFGHPAVIAQWAQPSTLPGYSVGGLAAHVLLGVVRLEQVLVETLPDQVVVVDLPAFFGGNRIETPDDLAGALPTFLRKVGEEQAARGPTETVAAYLAAVLRVESLLAASESRRLVAVFSVENGATDLSTYLRTRVVELVVHGDDLVACTGITAPPLPQAAADVTLGVVLELARARAGDLGAIRAFTRRERGDPDDLRVF